jgi:ferritin
VETWIAASQGATLRERSRDQALGESQVLRLESEEQVLESLNAFARRRTMISSKIVDGFNQQINAEFYSAFLYLQMAAYFESKNLPGFANWMRVQKLEEEVHAMKFFNHVAERDADVKLMTIDAPPLEWKSPLDVFEYAYKHEQKVTGMIGSLVELAEAEKDHAARTFLTWFVDEQVEEESSTNAVVQKLKLIGNEGGGLFMIDRELATRVFTPPPVTGGTKAPPAAVGA